MSRGGVTAEAEVVDELPDYMGDRKQSLESRVPLDPQQFEGAFIETVCPLCDKQVAAFVIDGPDPVFVDLQCPRDPCGHEFTERIA